MITVVIDARPAYLSGPRAGASLLTLPLGRETVLRAVAAQAAAGGGTDFRVLPLFSTDDAYERAILADGPRGTRIIRSSFIDTLTREGDADERVLIVDPRCWPVDGIDPALIADQERTRCWAVHAVAGRDVDGGVLERVLCDDEGCVHRIRRDYDEVTNSRIASVSYSIVPLSALDGCRFSSLPKLRLDLCGRGLLSRDVRLPGGHFDLTDVTGFLQLSERFTSDAIGLGEHGAYAPRRSGVLAASTAEIHPRARLIPPVIVQDDARVSADVTLVGPVTIGRGSRIGRASVIGQSVIGQGVDISSESMLSQRTVVGGTYRTASATMDNTDPRPHAARSQGVHHKAESSTRLGRPRAGRPALSMYARVKVLIDVVLAAAALIALSPVMAVVAVLIKLDSRGPVLFTHDREGRGGEVFRCYKFRTMHAGAHELQRSLQTRNDLDGPQFKLSDDPRITRIGSWLRHTNIDEIPQFINVLLGHMSIVGPRPSPFRENQICVAWRHGRLSVRPGITGLWQLCRRNRAGGDFHQWIAYDIAYVRRLSLWLDVKILVATVLSLGGRRRVPATWLIGTDPVTASSSFPAVRSPLSL